MLQHFAREQSTLYALKFIFMVLYKKPKLKMEGRVDIQEGRGLSVRLATVLQLEFHLTNGQHPL